MISGCATKERPSALLGLVGTGYSLNGVGYSLNGVGLEVLPWGVPFDPETTISYLEGLMGKSFEKSKNLEITVSPGKGERVWKVTMIGPSDGLALDKKGYWELHEFELRVVGMLLVLDHLDSYCVRSPANERPASSRFVADKGNIVGRNQYAELEKFVKRIAT